MDERRVKSCVWIARLLIAAVTFLNVQAAFQFMLRPQDYAWGFELTGVPGEAMLQGLGLLFLMWNVPYAFALASPIKNFISLISAVIMQFIGFSGESLILLRLTGEHPLITSSVTRFIIFDGAGLLALLLALGLAVSVKSAEAKKA